MVPCTHMLYSNYKFFTHTLHECLVPWYKHRCDAMHVSLPQEKYTVPLPHAYKHYMVMNTPDK